jgi:hypothetical protein
MYEIMADKLNKTEINRRLKEIENGIDKLKREKQQLLKMQQELKHQEQIKNPIVHLREIKKKYLVANTRVADKVHSLYIGKKDNWENWENNKELREYAIKNMKLKLKEKGYR